MKWWNPERRTTVTVKYQLLMLALAVWGLVSGGLLAYSLSRATPTADNVVDLVLASPEAKQKLADGILPEIIQAAEKIAAEKQQKGDKAERVSP